MTSPSLFLRHETIYSTMAKTDPPQGNGIPNNSGLSEYGKSTITYCKYALLHLSMINCNPSLLHFNKYTHVYTFSTIAFYLNFSRYKFPMLMYLIYRLFENNNNKTCHHSSNFPFIKMKLIYFYPISKIQSLYIYSYQIYRNV